MENTNLFYSKTTLQYQVKKQIITEIFESFEKQKLSLNQIDEILDLVKAELRDKIVTQC